jgi:uncharacterized protein YjbI with pentapeptide repeats
MTKEQTLRRVTKEQIAEILKQHSLWLATDGRQGERASFFNANCTGANFKYVKGSGVDFSGSILIKANLRKVDFENADFKSATLTRAYMPFANFAYANFCAADLEYACVRNSSFYAVDLEHAYLKGVNISEAYTEKASLRKVQYE